MARQVADLPFAQERRLAMTYDAYLTWYGESHRGEWVRGEVVVFKPPTGRHQDLVLFLGSSLSWFACRFDLGIVRLAPYEMLVLDGRVSGQPDLLFVGHLNADRLIPLRLDGPADLVVEIVSDDSVTRDRRDKLAEHQDPEYWRLDPREGQQRARFFHLADDGTYQTARLDAAGRYRSRVLPGFRLDPAWLWQDPLPDPDALKPVILADLDRDRHGTTEAVGRAPAHDRDAAP